MNPLEAVEQLVTTSLADEIALRLARGILEGEYTPGDHLLQGELCARFGVSRTPVREALRKLQAQNLVLVRPNKGATVRVPTRAELDEAWTIRAELESFACELACRKMTPETLEELGRAQTMIELAEETLDNTTPGEEEEAHLYDQIADGNEQFHSAILRAAHNAQLKSLCESLQSYLPKDYVWRAVRLSGTTRSLNVDEHRVIYDGLARGDKRAARKAMKAHINHAEAVLIDYLTEHGFWDSSNVDPD